MTLTGYANPYNPATPYHHGSAPVTGEVPHPYSLAIAGRTYVIDTKRDWGRESIPLLRGQADQSPRPGEVSLNPDDLWRRNVESWHHGAGQTWNDREDSDPHRFRASKGVDVWTKWGASLLPDTDEKLSSASTNLLLVAVGTRLYAADNQTLKYTSDITVDSPTWTSVTGTPAAAITGLTSDGYNVWAAYSANGVWVTNRTIGTASAYVTGAPTVTALGYVKGRLMVAVGPSIYNVTASGALPTVLLTHANTDFAWVGFAEGQGFIYAAGYSGDKSLIYRIAVKTDGTGLDAPVVAGELPDGEIVRSVGGYLGFVLIGTDQGVRFALGDSAGNLEIGALIETGSAVRCFEGQDRFAWYGLTNPDAVSTGLGRLDLSVFTAPNTPAYASDLMVTGQGAVLSVATFQELRVLAVSGLGIYAQDTDLVPEGHIDGGLVGYNLPDPKVAMFADVRHDPLAGTIGPSISVDEGTFTTLGTSNAQGSVGKKFPLGGKRGDRFETRLTLTRDDSPTTDGPTVSRVTLEAYPAPARRGRWTLWLFCRTRVVPPGLDAERDRDAADDLQHIIDLCDNAAPTTLQVLRETFDCVVADYKWHPEILTSDGEVFDGVCEVDVKLLAIQ